MPPLYKAMPKNGEEEYLYDDKALEHYRKKHTGPFTLQRYKGLGEMDAQQLWETTLDPETPDVEAGRDRGCENGLQCDGNADGNRSSAETFFHI